MKNNSEKTKARLLIIVLAAFGLVACGGGGGSSAPASISANLSSTARTSLIANGDTDCPFGGTLVESGIDDNGNGVLDNNEVDNSEKVCNGSPGAVSLVEINSEPAGANCAAGGLRIDTGIDSNANAVLDATEVSQSSYVCNGDNGAVGWQGAMLIQADSTENANSFDVAINSSGDAIAVWNQYGATNQDIWFNRYVAGTGWGVAERVATNAYNPQVAIDNNGNAIAVWYQYSGSSEVVWSSRYVPGTGWGVAEIVVTKSVPIERLRLVGNAAGDAAILWLASNGTDSDVWSNRYVPGSGWGVDEPVENNTGNAFQSEMAIDKNGNAVAVWSQSDGTYLNAWSNRYVPGTGWGVAELIETNAGNAYSIKVAVNNAGIAVAVWEQNDTVKYNIWSNRYAPGAGWGTAELIETIDTANATAADVVLDNNGSAVAVWEQNFGVWSNRYLASTGWDIAKRIDNDYAYIMPPSVSAGANGEFLSVWEQNDGSQARVISNRYVPGIGWGTVEIVASNIAISGEPVLSANGKGDTVVVWNNYNGSTFNIWSNYRPAP